MFEVKNIYETGEPFHLSVTFPLARLFFSALSSSGGAVNAHMFPFSLSYLTCLRGLAAYESDATETSGEGWGIVRRRCLVTVSARYLF